jgi:predicted ATPase
MAASIKNILLQNVLSFGLDNPALELRPLNVFIGPNGSGKSNLIECLNVMRACPKDISFNRIVTPASDFLWKGTTSPVGTLEIHTSGGSLFHHSLKHRLMFESNSSSDFYLIDETIENVDFHYHYHPGDEPVFNWADTQKTKIRNIMDSINAKITSKQSILSQRKDPSRYLEFYVLDDFYSSIRIYRDWNFGRHTAPRKGQDTDLPRTFLEEDASNLALVLNALEEFPEVHPRILDLLQEFDEGITNYRTTLSGTNEIQLYLHYAGLTKGIPATRLSDGTLRYLCLLAILCHPNPPSVICIEEPEIGLHPDSILAIAKLLKETSERTQLFVTTHSEILVDMLSDTPESVVVCEKHNGQTSMKRLDPEKLSIWLDDYRLGQLWTMGQIGGNRW